MQGVFRESNSGPLAPEARIIPLDQTPDLEVQKVLNNLFKHECLVIGLIGYCVLFDMWYGKLESCVLRS
jgi:hypothetical protein